MRGGQGHRKISEGPGCASGKGSHRNMVAPSPCAGAACCWEAESICGLLGGAVGSDLVCIQTGSALMVPKPLILKGRELLLWEVDGLKNWFVSCHAFVSGTTQSMNTDIVAP